MCFSSRVISSSNFAPKTLCPPSRARGVAALNHEVRDDAVEGHAVVVPALGELQEILARLGGVLVVQLHRDWSDGGVQGHLGGRGNVLLVRHGGDGAGVARRAQGSGRGRREGGRRRRDGECPTFTHARRIFTSARRARQRTRRRSKWAVSLSARARAAATAAEHSGNAPRPERRCERSLGPICRRDPAGSADGARRDRVSSPRTRPRAFSSFEYFTSAVEPHADQPRPDYPFPLARQDGDGGEGTSGYGPMGGGGRGAGSLASQLQGMRRGGGSDYAGSDVGGRASSVVGGPGSDAGGLRGNSGASAAAAGLPPRSGAGARLDPLGHPAGPGPGVLSSSAPGSALGPAPSVAGSRRSGGLPSAAAALAAPPAGTTSTGAFPPPVARLSGAPHGRSTRRRSPGRDRRLTLRR